METGIDKAKLLHYKAVVIKHLSDPAKLRLVVVGAMAGMMIGLVYVPFSDRIAGRRRALSAEIARRASIHDVEKLRTQAQSCREHVGQAGDTNEWVQYLLEGLRDKDVMLRDMASRQPKKIGPYQTVTLTLEVAGTYAQLKGFLEWLEGSDRLVRVDTVRIEKKPGTLQMKITILGLIRKHASTA